MTRTRQQRIEQVKAFITISELHKANGIEYKDKNIDDHIQGLKWELEALTNDAIVTELDRVWATIN